RRSSDLTAVQPQPMAGADPARGRRVIEQVGCGACHLIPGVSWPQGRVGPSLDGFGSQALIGGRFPNRPEILARWVRDAPSLAPRTGMPAMPMTEPEARDVAAYLYTLDAR
ncbi:MAG: c-type cytochrome, partial [Phenylobacterium sp.]|nr:c-type cytochrome [Phenylobacterium sp.]